MLAWAIWAVLTALAVAKEDDYTICLAFELLEFNTFEGLKLYKKHFEGVGLAIAIAMSRRDISRNFYARNVPRMPRSKNFVKFSRSRCAENAET